MACLAMADTMVVHSVFSSEAVSGVTTVKSDPISLSPDDNFGIMVECSGSGPNIKIYYEVSWQYGSDYEPPERAINIFGPLPDGSDTTIADTDIHYESFSPPPMPYIKIVLEGIAGNAADSTVTVKVISQ